MVLYIGNARPYGPLIKKLVAQAGDQASWIVMPQIHWGPGIVVPTGSIDGMISLCDRFKRDGQQYDRRLSRWFEYNEIECYYPWPSLVDHRDGPSLVQGRGGRRQAYERVDDALSVDWSGGRVRYNSVDPSTARQHRLRKKAEMVAKRNADMLAKLERGESV
jgi:hypothetical protein